MDEAIEDEINYCIACQSTDLPKPPAKSLAHIKYRHSRTTY